MPDAPLRRWLESRWYGASAPWALRPLAGLYRLAIALRRLAYQRGWLRGAHPGVPVVIVGNLTVGGTGKTPLVIWLARRLALAGVRAGIVLRGYGASVRSPRLVEKGQDVAAAGDEALLLREATECLVAAGADRAAAARLLVAAGCQLVLADDGLQHLPLHRDLEILVVDGERGFGNGSLLPAGPLREPAARMGTVPFVVVHGDDRRQVAPASSLRMTLAAESLESLDGERSQDLAWLRGQRLHAVAGTGNPQRFFAQLRALGALPVEHPFPDHHRYRPADLAFDDGLAIVMTAKDAVKCRAFANPRLWCLNVRATLSEADAGRLMDGVMAVVSNRGP